VGRVRVEKDYEDLLRLFNRHKVRYCIVGAFAVAFHARPRFTKDIDILISPDLENARRVLHALENFGFKKVGLCIEDFTVEGKVIQLGFEPVRVDILTSIPGVNFPEVWKNRVTGRYGRTRVNFIGLDQLIKSKRKSKRKQDQADLELLLRVRKERGG